MPALLLAASLGACAGPAASRTSSSKSVTSEPRSPSARAGKAPGTEEGIASYYSRALEGRSTASGEPYRGAAATCAHRTHSFGTRLRVTSLRTGTSVLCRVNDRGPFVKGRIVDLSLHLARELGIVEQGIARVRVEPVKR